MRKPAASKGFTLLEVMVALAILSIALVASMKAIGSLVNNEVYLKERTLAHWVAMNQVAEMRASGAWPNAGQLNGSAMMAGREFIWQINVTAFGDDARRLDVNVSPEDEPDRQLTALIAFLGKAST